MMQELKPWERYAAPAPMVPLGGGYTVGRPNPRLAAQEDRAERADLRAQREADRAEQRFRAQQARDDMRDARSAETDQRSQSNTTFDNLTSLRKEFTGRKEVQDFTTVLPQVAAAMEIARNPNATGADDLNLIYTFGKVMDPGSVVREGELALASSTGSWAQSIEGAIAKLQSGERLPPEVRRNLVESMRRRGVQLSRAYNFSRRDYQSRAQRFGFEPIDVVGEHPATPFQQVEADFTGNTIGNLDGSVGARPHRGGSDLGKQVQGLTVDNLADLASGLSGGRYAIREDGLYYTPPGGQPQAVDLADEIANSDEYRNAYRAKFGSLPPLQVSVSGGRENGDRADPANLPVERGAGGLIEDADAFVRGVADTVTLGTSDEIAAAGRTIFDGGTMRDNLRGERGVADYDQQNNPVARIGGQLAGGFLLPTGRAGTGLPPSAAELLRIGGAYGGAYGFGSGEGSFGDRLKSAGSGAVGGAAVGYGLGRLGQLLPQPGPPRGPMHPLMEAAQRQGIEPLAADIGGPMVGRLTAAAAQAPVSAGPIIRAGQRVNNQVGAARDRIARSVGAPGDAYAAGEAAQAGGRAFIDGSRAHVGRMYDRARQQAGDVRPVAQRAIDTLDANLAELAETPSTSAPVTAALERLGADLTNPNGLTVDALRRLRTNVRGLAHTDELRATDFERRAGQVLDAISEDIAAGLSGPALASFRAADRAHRVRLETIDQVLRPMIGGRGEKAFAPEQVFRNIEGASRSDSARLRRFINSLPEDERRTVTASLIGQLGRASAGTQNAEGTAFSAGQFLTHWNQMSGRAKTALFDGETRAALNDLARVAEGSRQAATYANRSNTGGAVVGNVSALLGIGYASPTAAVAGGAAQYVTGRLLASPRFTRFLARPARTAAERAAALRYLAGVASREPALQGEILPIQRLLSAQVGGSRPALADNRDQQR